MLQVHDELVFDADKAGLWLVEEGEFPFHVGASRGMSEDFLTQTRKMTWDTNAVGVQAARERRTIVVRGANTRAGVGAMQRTYKDEGIQTACLVPLVSHDQALGVIGLYHTRDREWPDDEVALAQSFANQAAVAISNARLYRSVAEQAARIRSIQDLSSRLNRLTDVQAIADAIVSEASSLAAYHDIRVYVVNWETRFCEPVAFTDIRETARTEKNLGLAVDDVAETVVLRRHRIRHHRNLTVSIVPGLNL